MAFLGHVITTEEVKIEPIKKLDYSKNNKELLSFMEFLNFYRRYVDKFAQTIEPLIELLRKDRKWKWEERHRDALNKTKEMFVKEVMTAFPDFNKPFYINTDASMW